MQDKTNMPNSVFEAAPTQQALPQERLVKWHASHWLSTTAELGNNACATPIASVDLAKEELLYTEEVKAYTDGLYAQISDFITPAEWPIYAPLVYHINRLKEQKNAVILAHNYMTPDIFALVGDYRGDSLGLAIQAKKTSADIIVQAGVHFMAETSKILCPDKKVLISSLRAGCSLASSITGKDMKLIRQQYPGVPIVTYVNTSAEIKAYSDICCTSSNAVQVVESLGVDKVIMLPDEYLAKNVANMTNVEIIAWQGKCEVHARFDAQDVRDMREAYPQAIVLAHPECPPEVVAESDFTGSTKAMSDYVRTHSAVQNSANVILLTECSMSDNVAIENPQATFIRPCNLCPHMKRITLAGIYKALRDECYEVHVAEELAQKARLSVERMLALAHQKTPQVDFNPQAPHKKIELIARF